VARSAVEGSLVRAYGATVLRWRWAIVVLTLLAVVVAGVGLRGLTFNADSRLFFGPEDPGRQALDALESTYTKASGLLFVLAPADGEVFTNATLEAVAALTERAWRLPWTTRVNALTNFQHTYAEGDELIVEDLVPDPAALGPEALTAARAIALEHDELVDLMVSASGHVTAVSVEILKPGKDRGEVEEVVDAARAILAELRAAHPEIAFYLTGGLMADITFADAAKRDVVTLVPIVVLLVTAMLAIGLSSLTGALVTLVVVVFAVVISLGLAGWAGVVLNAATAGTPIVIMTLGVADCVHIISSMRQREGDATDRAAAVLESLRINTTPVAITSLTTAIGFLTLNFSESPPLRDFGNIVALGVVVAYLLSVTFLPAVLALLPTGAAPRLDIRPLMRHLAGAVIARRRVLLVLGPLLVLGCALGLPRLVIDDDIVRYFDESFAFRSDTDFVAANLMGLNSLQFSLPAGAEHGIAEPDYLASIDRFAEWYRGEPGVQHVVVLSDTLKRLNMNMNGDDPAYYRLPESRELAAQYLLLYEMSLPFGQDLNNRIDVARSATRVTVHLADVTSAEVRDLAARGEAWLAENAPEIAAPATGLSLLYANMSKRNVVSMLWGTAVALVLISAVLLVVMRSVPLGLVSLLPNLVPAAMAFGLWGYLDGEVNLAVSVVGAMTLGIVVDDTVHLLSRYLRARRERDLEPIEAARYAVTAVGTPVLVTSVALVIGFGALAFSGFAVSALMGKLAAITIFLALIADLVFLPPLLISLGRRVT
jgi:predicted RND superfamily exporter protein